MGPDRGTGRTVRTWWEGAWQEQVGGNSCCGLRSVGQARRVTGHVAFGQAGGGRAESGPRADLSLLLVSGSAAQGLLGEQMEDAPILASPGHEWLEAPWAQGSAVCLPDDCWTSLFHMPPHPPRGQRRRSCKCPGPPSGPAPALRLVDPSQLGGLPQPRCLDASLHCTLADEDMWCAGPCPAHRATSASEQTPSSVVLTC